MSSDEIDPIPADHEEQHPDMAGGGMAPEPSCVLHFRNLPHDVRRSDLLNVAKPFGSVVKFVHLRQKNQALMQMDDITTAEAMVKYYATVPINIRGRDVYVQFSSHSELNSVDNSGDYRSGGDRYGMRSGSGGGGGGGGGGASGMMGGEGMEMPPNRILLAIIANPVFPVNVDFIHQLFTPFGFIEKIVTFSKNQNVQALVQFQHVQNAVHAKSMLHNAQLSNGGTVLELHFSNMQELQVRYNNDRTRDYTTAPMGGVPMQGGMPPYYAPDRSYDIGGPRGRGAGAGAGYGDMNALRTVLIVSNLNPDHVNCDILFNLFSNYGNVIKIRILRRKPDHALVQMEENSQAATAVKYLKGLTLFGKELDVNFSKHNQIANSSYDAGDDAFLRDYSAVGHKMRQGNRPQHVCPPTALLHISNVHPEATPEDVLEKFGEFNPKDKKLFDVNGRKQCLVQFEDASAAAEALCLVHNTPLMGQNIRVSFSRNSI